MDIRSEPYFFFIIKISTLAGDFEWRMKFLARLLSMHFRNSTYFVCDKFWIGPKGGCPPSCKFRVQSYDRCSGTMSTFLFWNTSWKSSYCFDILVVEVVSPLVGVSYMTNDVPSLEDLMNSLAPIIKGFLVCDFLTDLAFMENVMLRNLQSMDGLWSTNHEISRLIGIDGGSNDIKDNIITMLFERHFYRFKFMGDTAW